MVATGDGLGEYCKRELKTEFGEHQGESGKEEGEDGKEGIDKRGMAG